MSALLFGDEFDGVRAGLAFVSLLNALGYYGLMERPASALRTAVKTAAIAALVPLPLMGLGGTAMPRLALGLLAGALVLSSIGDYFLALQDGQRNFVRGLGAFLGAHLCYLLVLLPRTTAPGGLQIATILVLLSLAGAILAWLWAVLGRLRVPVTIYLTMICLMALAAISMPLPLLAIGALLFVFSDAVIAVDKFRMAIRWRGPIIWTTYYAGQVLLVSNLLLLLR